MAGFPRAVVILLLVVVALVLVAAQDGGIAKASVGTDVDGNVHITTANSTTQRVFINGVDVLGELNRLSALVEQYFPDESATTATPPT
jgi:hypothetical protein